MGRTTRHFECHVRGGNAFYIYVVKILDTCIAIIAVDGYGCGVDLATSYTVWTDSLIYGHAKLLT